MVKIQDVKSLWWLALAVMIMVSVAIALTFVPVVSVIFEREYQFTRLPESDGYLIRELKRQPNVVENTVHVTRHDDRSLTVTFIATRPFFVRSLPFDLDGMMQRLGYLRE